MVMATTLLYRLPTKGTAMSKPTNAEIRERHNRSVHQILDLANEGNSDVNTLRCALSAYNECRADRGILLDRLEAAEKKCKWCGVPHERGMNTLCPFTKAEQTIKKVREELTKSCEYGGCWADLCALCRIKELIGDKQP